MFPRKVALDTALAVTRKEDKASWNTRMREDIGAWLESLNLYSSELLLSHVALVELLAEHYLKLLQANGENINLLIEDAYRQRDHFKQFVETITAAENEIDRQVMEKLASNEKVQEKIIAEQQQIAKRRRKIMDEIF
jgi:hypothetical protein